MMACGHRAQSLGKKGGEPESRRRPACVICDCFEVDDTAPSLDGRIAKCASCGGNERPSADDLAFFEYLGPGSLESVAKCVCGLYERPHRKPWKVTIGVDQNWFKRGRIEMERHATIYADTEEDAQQEAERERERMANWYGPDGGKEETRIFGARIISVAPIPRTAECKKFVPRGPSAFDKYYCGCRGWD